MLLQRTLKNAIKTTGVGLAHRRARGNGACARRRRTPASCFIARICRDAVAHSRARGQRRRHAALVHAQGRRRQRVDRRAPDVGARRAGHRQPVRRHRRPRNPDHGRQRRPVRVPAAVRRHRGAGGAQALPAHHRRTVEVQRRRQVGALRALRRLQARLHDRLPASGIRLGEPQRRRRLRGELLREGSGARAHVRLHAGRGGDARSRAGLGRQPAERDRARRVQGAEQRGPALRQRVRAAQGARRHRRPVSARPSADRPVHGVQVRATRSTICSRARCSRARTRSRSPRSPTRRPSPSRSTTGRCSPPDLPRSPRIRVNR